MVPLKQPLNGSSNPEPLWHMDPWGINFWILSWPSFQKAPAPLTELKEWFPKPLNPSTLKIKP